MKIYSADSISRSDIDAIDAKQTEQLNKQAEELNKHAAQVHKLRIWLAASFVANLLVTVGLYFIGR